MKNSVVCSYCYGKLKVVATPPPMNHLALIKAAKTKAAALRAAQLAHKPSAKGIV